MPPLSPNRPYIAQGFSRAALKPVLHDVSAVMNRPAPGLDHQVQRSLQTIMCEEDPSVGVVGWFIRQNGLSYGVRIKDGFNNDAFGIGLEVPGGRSFLHRETTMSVAEKAHVVALIQQALKTAQPDHHRFLVWQFGQLERACSNPAVGVVKTGPPLGFKGINRSLYAHFGFGFPPDDRCTDKPDTVLLALEWTEGAKYCRIDCSRAWPVFLIGSSIFSEGPLMCMAQGEAKQSASAAQVLAKAKPDPRLDKVWNIIEIAADMHPSTRTPPPP